MKTGTVTAVTAWLYICCKAIHADSEGTRFESRPKRLLFGAQMLRGFHHSSQASSRIIFRNRPQIVYPKPFNLLYIITLSSRRIPLISFDIRCVNEGKWIRGKHSEDEHCNTHFNKKASTSIWKTRGCSHSNPSNFEWEQARGP
jgi:hypothetical protein